MLFSRLSSTSMLSSFYLSSLLVASVYSDSQIRCDELEFEHGGPTCLGVIYRTSSCLVTRVLRLILGRLLVSANWSSCYHHYLINWQSSGIGFWDCTVESFATAVVSNFHCWHSCREFVSVIGPLFEVKWSSSARMSFSDAVLALHWRALSMFIECMLFLGKLLCFYVEMLTFTPTYFSFWFHLSSSLWISVQQAWHMRLQ